MVKRKSACAAQMHRATDAPVGAPPSRRHAPNAGACALVTAPTRFQPRQGGQPCSSCGPPPVVTVVQRGCGAQRSATVEASRRACSGLQRTTVPISGERATNLDEAAKRAIHTSTPREHATNSMTTARRHDTSENEPPSGGACKKAQRFNRCEGCPKAEEATGRLGGFNPIGKNQPDQKGLNPPDQVRASPPQEYSRIRPPRSGLRHREHRRAGTRTSPTGRHRVGEGREATLQRPMAVPETAARPQANTRPHTRKPRPADAGRGVLTRRGVRV